jgi:hypothetical protein
MALRKPCLVYKLRSSCEKHRIVAMGRQHEGFVTFSAERAAKARYPTVGGQKTRPAARVLRDLQVHGNTYRDE